MTQICTAIQFELMKCTGSRTSTEYDMTWNSMMFQHGHQNWHIANYTRGNSG